MGNQLSSELKEKLKRGALWELNVKILYNMDPNKLKTIENFDQSTYKLLLEWIKFEYKKRFPKEIPKEISKLLGDF